ncbi:MAG: outer membrane lipoprotein carrier protein LolA [Syntrophaceae bacterium]|nr:outer membrane lipoprotein carrier protein LolA [Syntrophaceae bacterium]
MKFITARQNSLPHSTVLSSARRRRLRRLFVLLSVLWLPVLAFLILPEAIRAEAPPLDKLLADMQERYEKTESLKGRFIQEVTVKGSKKAEREEGTVYFRNPGRMAWHYEKPKAKKLIIGPKTSWLYVPEDRAVYVQRAESLLKSRLTIRFFTGLGKLREDFQIEYAKPEAIDREGNLLLVLTPRDPGLGISRLHLTVGREDLQVHEVRFTDSFGNLTRVAFRDLQENVRISDRTFSFKPPKGVEVLQLP